MGWTYGAMGETQITASRAGGGGGGGGVGGGEGWRGGGGGGYSVFSEIMSAYS